MAPSQSYISAWQVSGERSDYDYESEKKDAFKKSPPIVTHGHPLVLPLAGDGVAFGIPLIWLF